MPTFTGSISKSEIQPARPGLFSDLNAPVADSLNGWVANYQSRQRSAPIRAGMGLDEPTFGPDFVINSGDRSELESFALNLIRSRAPDNGWTL